MEEDFLTLKCIGCGKTKKKTDFSKTPISNQNKGYESYCKSCKKEFIKTKNDLIEYLKQHEIKYEEDTYKIAYEYIKKRELKKYKKNEFPDDFENKLFSAIIGKYFSIINLQGSNKASHLCKNINKNITNNDFNITDDNINNTFDIQVDNELVLKWGKWEQEEDYYKLEDFCTRMIEFNNIETPQDVFYLRKLAVISLQMDKELLAGHYNQAKQLGDLFSKYMADSKFRAMDISDATKSGGLRTFSHAYMEIEKDGFIPPWEEYRKIKGLKQDIVDKTIMYILNYTLKLNKMAQLIEPPYDTPKIEEMDDIYVKSQ